MPIQSFRLILAATFLFWLPAIPQATAAPLQPSQIAVVYNPNTAGSKETAELYAELRNVPAQNLIALACQTEETISRQQFRTSIEQPLQQIFTERRMWELAETPNGTQAMRNSIRVILLIHGIPLRISRDEADAKGKEHLLAINESSVDSELTLLGALNSPIEAHVANPYFKNEQSFALFPMSPLMLVGRLDGPSPEAARRLVRDAVAVEKEGGLWGRGYFDISGRHQLGDNWIRNAFQASWEAGIPSHIHRIPQTYRRNYPMADAALYYGWYDEHRSGPLLNPEWRFRPGAIAVHIHSYSATSLRTTEQQWCGPLVNKGAHTLGNTWEPFLEFTHQLDVFNQSLLNGHTFIEAAYQSMPVLSWMGVAIGDPLYRPFAGRNNITAGDKDGDYKAIHLAIKRWGIESRDLKRELQAAGERMNSGLMFETIGLLHSREEKGIEASNAFDRARQAYTHPADKLRCDLLHVETLMMRDRNNFATRHLREMIEAYAQQPEIEAAKGLLQILSP